MNMHTILELMDRTFAVVLDAMKDVLHEELEAERMTSQYAADLYNAIGRHASKALQHAVALSEEEEPVGREAGPK
jgi:hypothetical protein